MGDPMTNKPKEANNHQLKLLRMTSIERAFPVEFKDTGFKVETIAFVCGHCETDIPMTDVHGNVSQMIERVIDIDSVGLCPKCRFITPFKLRVHSNRQCEWQTMDGTWNSYMAYPPTKAGVKMAFKEMLLVIKERIFGNSHG